jgi:Transmembrane protein of unknown function (DUF3556)
MGFILPQKPPYSPLTWRRLPLAERGRQVCAAWALQGYGSPHAIFLVYAAKIGLFVLGWMLWCGLSPSLGTPRQVATWWLEPLAFQKAILWSILFEVVGLGCGSGPLTGRYFPPFGGALYFLRPGTTKAPLFPGVPVIGRPLRGVLDVLLYTALLVSLVRALLAPQLEPLLVLPVVVLLPLLGVLDRTVFLAARAEHYWVTAVCFLSPAWIAGAKCVQLALWFWAGASKLNHHFPAVVCVMTSNSPVARFEWLRRLMYRSFPDDLRPSRLATYLGHAGTALEFSVALVFALTPVGVTPVLGLVLMLMLHAHITSSVPAGVPLEWNLVVAYGGFALFYAHPDVSFLALGSWPLAAFVAVMGIAVPLLGNLFPHRVSFLMAMRYYAGNWAYSVWLFRGKAHEKLARLTKSSPWVHDQLARFYDEETRVGLVGRLIAFRMMHLHGRALSILIPKAVDKLEDYEWVDGEVVAGLVLGWNFGDGHLHDERLLRAVQAQCGFEDGELRCVFVEAQPLLGKTLSYRVADAARGEMAAGELGVKELRDRQPWGSAPAAG